METTFQYPTTEQIERNMQEARRLRAETVHELLKSARAWLVDAVRTRTRNSRGTFGNVSHA
jgi:hypothetical protein